MKDRIKRNNRKRDRERKREGNIVIKKDKNLTQRDKTRKMKDRIKRNNRKRDRERGRGKFMFEREKTEKSKYMQIETNR